MAITALDASALSQHIHAREVSCVEVMQAYLAQWDRVNPRLNALVSRRPAEAVLADARRCDDGMTRRGAEAVAG